MYFKAGSRIRFQGSTRMILVTSLVVGQVFLRVRHFSYIKDISLNVLYSYSSIYHRRYAH
jgi:hypothetical protein